MDQIKPNLYISSKDLPEVKGWKVGESYDLIANAKLTGIRESNGSIEATFEVQNIMSADKDPMDLADINNINDNEGFMRASSKIKQDVFSK